MQCYNFSMSSIPTAIRTTSTSNTFQLVNIKQIRMNLYVTGGSHSGDEYFHFGSDAVRTSKDLRMFLRNVLVPSSESNITQSKQFLC
jgi:hypothetical protein